MSFLMLPMLLGLAAVSIPVIIHLLHRQRTTPVKWGAMQFLLESPLQLKRRKKIDHWLLMLLRMAAIALLVFALSRPLMIEGRYSPLGDGLATDVAVVVDRSLSTARRAGDVSAYEQSVKVLDDVVKGMRPADTLSVVLAEHRPQAQSVRLSPAKAADVSRKLKEMGPGMSDASIPEAVQAARELVAEGRNPRKMVLVLSDEQRNAWAVDNHAAWQLAVGKQTSTSGVKVYALPFVPDGRASDVAISDVSIAPSLLGPDRPAQITATVANSGPDPVGSLNVQFLVDGKPVDARPVPSLPAGESRTLRFDHTFAEPGSHYVTVRADLTDAIEADNTATLAANVWQKLPVLIIDGQLTTAGDFRSSQFLRAAMQPVADAADDDKTLVQPKVVSVTRAGEEKLEDYAAVVVNDAPRLPAELLAKLADRVRSGGAAWFILGPRTDQEFIARDLGDAGLFAAAVKGKTEPDAKAAAGATQQRQSPPVEVKDARHPAVQLITAAERNALAGTVTRGWWSIVPQSGDARVILATTSGDPLVLERPMGMLGGRVAVWATDAGGAWNNWHVLPHFVPLVNETLYHLAAGQTRGLENRRLSAGQEIVWSGPAEPPVTRATLSRPDGSTADLTPRLVNGRHILSYNDTFQPGLYALRFDQTAVPQPVYFGVGIDPRELETTALAESDHRWLTDRGFIEKRLNGPQELASAVGAVNKGDDIWPMLAGILLLTLVSETFMTWRMIRHQSPATADVGAVVA